MCFQDVVSPPSHATVYTRSLSNCGSHQGFEMSKNCLGLAMESSL